ncbi:MAG: hypothetical protein WD876_03425 [Candidatus Pacearchaeota archaeon]
MGSIDEMVALKRVIGFYDNNGEDFAGLPVSEDNKRISEDVIREPYDKLRIIAPNHLLLKLVTIHPNGQGIEFSSKFHRRFTRVDDDWSSRAYLRYKYSLEKELNK